MEVVGRGPTRLTRTDVLCPPHSCLGSPSALTSCLPALAPHASHTGVGKSGPKASIQPSYPPTHQHTKASSPGPWLPPSTHLHKEWWPGKDFSKVATLEGSASGFNLRLWAATGAAQLSSSPSNVCPYETHYNITDLISVFGHN